MDQDRGKAAASDIGADRLWDVWDVAKFLHVSVHWVRKNQEEIDGLLRIKGNVRFDPAAVKAYAASFGAARSA